jgi:hypothetical protein
MEALIDKLSEEVLAWSQTPTAEGGIADDLDIQAIYFGDPGVIPVSLYPCVTVEPEVDDPLSETTGYDTRELRVVISIHIDARNYFDSGVDEAMGDRLLVRATNSLRRWFSRRSRRTMDGHWRALAVQETEYRARARADVVAKTARTTLIVTKNYQRILD